jgi:hypothetical protein
MSISAASEIARPLAGVGGSNPSPPTTKALVNGLHYATLSATLCARPRTGRASSRFGTEP